MGRTDANIDKWQGNGFSHNRSDAFPAMDRCLPAMAASHCVFTWLIQKNIKPLLVSRVSKQPTAKHIWNVLVVTYGSGGDKLQVYDLYTRASMVKQGNQSLEETWSTLQDLWLSIDQKQTNQMKYPEDIKIHDRFIQEMRLYQFLIAIDNKYETIKREIVKMEPLPLVDQAYNLVQCEETRSLGLQPGNTNNGVTEDGGGLDSSFEEGRINPAAGCTTV